MTVQVMMDPTPAMKTSGTASIHQLRTTALQPRSSLAEKAGKHVDLLIVRGERL
jgi:hypothetical protein